MSSWPGAIRRKNRGIVPSSTLPRGLRSDASGASCRPSSTSWCSSPPVPWRRSSVVAPRPGTSTCSKPRSLDAVAGLAHQRVTGTQSARGSGSGVRRASIAARCGSSHGGRMILSAELLDRAVDREAGLLRRDLEEDAARLAEVDRVEVVAVDEPAVRACRPRARRSSHCAVLGVGRAPRDVVDRARALAAPRSLGAGRARSSRRAARRAAPTRRRRAGSAPIRRSRSSAGRLPARWLYARTPSKPWSASSAGISGCSATSGASPVASTTSSWPRPSGSAKRSDVALALDRDALGRRAARPRSRAPPASRRARRSRCTIPAPGAARDRARVLEEREVGAGAAVLVAVEQVVDARVVLVDRLGGQPQAEHARVEVDVARRVARDRGDVVDAVESHPRRSLLVRDFPET